MTDRIDSAVIGASAARLRRLISLADAQPQTTEAVIPRLGDPTELAAVLDEIVPAASDGNQLVAAALDSATPLAELEKIHREGRELIKRAQNLTQQAAAELLYHAVVAAAYVRHGVNIASRPIEARRALYKRLARLLGSGPLAGIFSSLVEMHETTQARARDL
jgi:hypothetical protein